MKLRLYSSAFNIIEHILNAPIGKVMSVLEEFLEYNVDLNIIEQNSSVQQQFVRKISITAMGMPIIRATVTFDSKNLPDFIMHDILMKKSTIGDILEKNGIDAIRRVKSLKQNVDGNRIFREYEIIKDDSSWFVIHEEIDLENLLTVLGAKHVQS